MDMPSWVAMNTFSVAVGLADGNELVPVVQGDGPDAGGADVFQLLLIHALDGAGAGHHYEEALLVDAPGRGAWWRSLAGLQRQYVHDIAAPGGALRSGYLVALADVHLAQYW
jgi:hypothetical protein